MRENIIYLIVGALLTYVFDRWKDRDKEKRNVINELIRAVWLVTTYKKAFLVSQNGQEYYLLQARLSAQVEDRFHFLKYFEIKQGYADEYYKLLSDATGQLVAALNRVQQLHSGYFQKEAIKEVDKLWQGDTDHLIFDYDKTTSDTFPEMYATFHQKIAEAQGQLNVECERVVKKIRVSFN